MNKTDPTGVLKGPKESLVDDGLLLKHLLLLSEFPSFPLVRAVEIIWKRNTIIKSFKSSAWIICGWSRRRVEETERRMNIAFKPFLLLACGSLGFCPGLAGVIECQLETHCLGVFRSLRSLGLEVKETHSG